MTDPKQFICSFLGIPETGFAEVVINSKLMVELMEAYHESKSKNEFGQPMFHPATNDTQSEYGTISIGRNHDGSETKYPNLLNATNRD